WFIGPGPFESTANSITSFTGTMASLPAESLTGNGGRLRLYTLVIGRSSTVDLANGVSAGDKCQCFFIIHRHSGKRLPDERSCFQWVRLSVRAFRIYINQAHMIGRKWSLQYTFIIVAFITHPF